MEELDFHLSQIARILGLAQPVGFMLSYEFEDIWIDVYLEREGEGWAGRTYTISVPKEKVERLRRLVESIGGVAEDVVSDSERAYLSLSYEDWESASPIIMSLL
ncbi:MAG: hypothetical protein N2648_00195 [Aquificaceae bacterium]|nr:hypothetical protein [Aquificaceae bacterium]MCS7196950.1 hypothetical protein [Aquificaceae bacterium]MCX7989052.1 hypothetical protein [Aquificaceae bacterium]MDW8032195.1 hypothetical protein [Aquificaceae bacterium]MDW8294168.1 hypothetical protein [Aquificaceae bacterium]